ncbi:DUF4249 domain-containing protein [Flavobacterium sp. GCM10027622]|uniref:DUF4249 domain-containing protein n=1 Tax=unclassified Flavobacterium TaxID=196869 RepID=UPI00360C9859
MVKRGQHLLLLFSFILIWSCTEPYALQTEDFEDVIVIEATLTDEYKYQEVRITRSLKLADNEPETVSQATVFITDSNGNHFAFSESNGKYVSQEEFSAIPNVTYQLHVTTADGKTYTSTQESIASLSSIDDLVVEVENSNEEGKGVQIVAKSTKTTSDNEYYRYTYEETNKIIAPRWIPYRGVAVYYNPPPTTSPDLGYIYMEPWPYEAKVCYTTENSKDILIGNTSLNNTATSSNLVRFLKVSDYKIAHRYSIEVTMYTQSQAANNYYDALRRASTNGSLLSQTQNGFYNGNIRNISNPTEKVVGFFDVCHMSKKRIFFNFDSLFPGHKKPEYPFYCPDSEDPNAGNFSHPVEFCSPQNPRQGCDGEYVLATVYHRVKSVYSFRPNYQIGLHLTSVALRNIQCGDCTSFSSNIKPPFWID